MEADREREERERANRADAERRRRQDEVASLVRRRKESLDAAPAGEENRAEQMRRQRQEVPPPLPPSSRSCFAAAAPDAAHALCSILCCKYCTSTRRVRVRALVDVQELRAMMAQRNSVTEVDDEERERRNRSEQTRRQREEVRYTQNSFCFTLASKSTLIATRECRLIT